MKYNKLTRLGTLNNIRDSNVDESLNLSLYLSLVNSNLQITYKIFDFSKGKQGIYSKHF